MILVWVRMKNFKHTLLNTECFKPTDIDTRKSICELRRPSRCNAHQSPHMSLGPPPPAASWWWKEWYSSVNVQNWRGKCIEHLVHLVLQVECQFYGPHRAWVHALGKRAKFDTSPLFGREEKRDISKREQPTKCTSKLWITNEWIYLINR